MVIVRPFRKRQNPVSHMLCEMSMRVPTIVLRTRPEVKIISLPLVSERRGRVIDAMIHPMK